jgi:hypothetical protein
MQQYFLFSLRSHEIVSVSAAGRQTNILIYPVPLYYIMG